MLSDLGLRQRKKAETRLAISRAALLLAVERGPDGVTVEDIALAADVSPRTVFNYFGTKEEAILGFDPSRALELGRVVLERPAKEPPLATLREAFIDIATANPEVAELARLRSELVREYPQLHPRHVAAYSAFEHALVEAIGQRTGIDPRRSMYPALVVSTATAAFRVAIDRAGPGHGELLAAINRAFDALGNGLRPPR